MSRLDDPMPWTVEANTHAMDYFVTAFLDLKDAPKRHAATLRTHQEGWKAVADAISRGLGEIARAIRDSNTSR